MPIDLIAPVHTPFDETGALNLNQIQPIAAHLAATGVSCVFVCGSTGEGMSLTVNERKEIADTWAEVALVHKLDVIVQVGANCQRDSMALAEHAAGLKVRSISAHAPSYFLPKSVDDLIEFFAPIAAAAEETPFYFYDIPALTGVRLPTAEFLSQGVERIPTLAGVKYTNDDLAQFQECLRHSDGRYELWFGCDEALLAGYALGARGAVGSTYNFMAPLYHKMVAAFDAGDQELARALQAKAVLTVNTLAEFGYAAAAKAVMQWHGIDCGPVRRPLRPLSRAEQKEVLTRIGAIGFPFDMDVSTALKNAANQNGESRTPSSAAAGS